MRRIVSIVAMFAVLLGGFAVFAACGNGDEGGETVYSSPTITLTYDSAVIAKGADYNLLDGVSVTDEYDADIAVTVQSNGGFDKDAVGTYTIVYAATNSHEKTSTEQRTVTVADYDAPVLGWAQAGNVQFGLPELTAALADAAVSVEYKASSAAEYTAVEPSEGVYSATLAAGTYTVRYTVEKDRFDVSKESALNVWSITKPEDKTVNAGESVTLDTPVLSENIQDKTVKVYYKSASAEDSAYTEVTPTGEEDAVSYVIESLSEGFYTVKYEVALTETENVSITYSVTAIQATIGDTTTQVVSDAGDVTLRKPTVSDGIEYAVTVREALPDAQPQALTAGPEGNYTLTVTKGSAYTVTYAYTLNGDPLKTENYMVYCPIADGTSNALMDYEDHGGEYVDGASGVTYTDFTGTDAGDVLISQDHALSGENSMMIHLYSPNWWGYTGLNLSFGTDINSVSFFMYSDRDFEVMKISLYLQADTGGLYSTEAVEIKAGWNKYTFTFSETFTSIEYYTFYAKPHNPAERGYFIYVDDVYFFNDSQA